MRIFEFTAEIGGAYTGTETTMEFEDDATNSEIFAAWTAWILDIVEGDYTEISSDN